MSTQRDLCHHGLDAETCGECWAERTAAVVADLARALAETRVPVRAVAAGDLIYRSEVDVDTAA